MKHLRQLSPGARKALIVVILLAYACPGPVGAVLQHIAALGVTVAAILALRIHPAGTHKTLTAVRVHHGLASLLTGHKPAAPAPEPTRAHAPVTGPQIPVN